MTGVNALDPRMATLRIVAAATAILLGAYGCHPGKATEGEAGAQEHHEAGRSVTLSSEQIRHGAIRWVPAEQALVTSSVETPGQLVPDEDRTARLGAPARGRITTIHVNVGDRVSIGQPLVSIESQEAASASADQAKAQAELNSRQAAASYARTARDRAERLLELKAVSRQDVERARADDELAQAAQAGADAELVRARASLNQLGVTTGGNIVVRTPIAGVVLKRDAVSGAVVDAGASLIAVTDVTTLWLQASAPETVGTALRPGAAVHFAVPAFPGETFEARVQNIGAGLDPLTRTLTVRAIARNPSARLRPEMFAKVWVTGGGARTAVVVPANAVQLLDDRPVVFVAFAGESGGTRFERRDVEIGSKTGDRAEIIGGLRPGESVVVQGAFALKSEFARAKIPSES
jgi:cobalt-zinc-cadmium efflux system membrane fusion protein